MFDDLGRFINVLLMIAARHVAPWIDRAAHEKLTVILIIG